jgi:hypothetical protein
MNPDLGSLSAVGEGLPTIRTHPGILECLILIDLIPTARTDGDDALHEESRGFRSLEERFCLVIIAIHGRYELGYGDIEEARISESLAEPVDARLRDTAADLRPDIVIGDRHRDGSIALI